MTWALALEYTMSVGRHGVEIVRRPWGAETLPTAVTSTGGAVVALRFGALPVGRQGVRGAELGDGRVATQFWTVVLRRVIAP